MLKIPRYFLAFIRAVLLIIPMAIFISSYLIGKKFLFKHTHDRAFALRRFYLRYTNVILGIKSEKQGNVPDFNALYISNHRSLSDPLILCQHIDAYIIAKAEVSKYPLISTGAELTGILYVDRQDRDSRSAVRQKMKETLNAGFNVLVYPEGTVNKELHTLPYRPGTFKEVAELGLPIVPVCLEYYDGKDLWHNRSMLKHFFLQFGFWRTRAKIVIGEALHPVNGEDYCQQVEAWTNNTIKSIHYSWKGSHFNDQLKTQNEEK